MRLGLGIKNKFSDLFIKKTGPRILRINPVLISCNQSCIMCWRKMINNKEKLTLIKMEKEKSLGLPDYKNLFNKLPSSVEVVDVTGGGEPLLYPSAFELLNLIKKKNLNGRLITNGVLLNNGFISNLVDINWDTVRISVHAATRMVYKKLHDKDDFKICIENVKRLKKISSGKMEINLLFVIQKSNLNQIVKFAEMCEELSVSAIEFDNLIAYRKGTRLDTSETDIVIRQLNHVKSNLRIKNNSSEVIKRFIDKQSFRGKKCSLVNDSIFISALGEVFACCLLAGTKLSMGNVKNDSLSTIWNKKTYMRFRSHLNKGIFSKDCLANCSYELPVLK